MEIYTTSYSDQLYFWSKSVSKLAVVLPAVYIGCLGWYLLIIGIIYYLYGYVPTYIINILNVNTYSN